MRPFIQPLPALLLCASIIACSYLSPQPGKKTAESSPIPEHVPAPAVAAPVQPAIPATEPAQPPRTGVQEPDETVTPSVEAKPKSAPVPPAAPAASPPSSPLRVTEVLWESVNLREGPGMNHKIIGSAKKGASLQVLEDKGSWLRVRLDNGKEVWVSKSATSWAAKTSTSTPVSAPTPPSSKRGPSKPLSPM